MADYHRAGKQGNEGADRAPSAAGTPVV